MKPEHEQALREMREWQEKKKAERAAKGVSEPPVFAVVPSETFEQLEPVEVNQRPLKPFIKYIRTLQDAPEGDRQDFVVRRFSQLHEKIEDDAEETGCHEYVVLNEGNQYCVWRLPR